MQRLFISLLLLAALSGCRKDIDLAEGQRFLFPLVADEQECETIRQYDPILNCFQQIEFLDKKRVNVIVTDIVNSGRYKHRGSHIIIEFDAAFDVEKMMKLEIIDQHTLRYNGHDFKRWKGPGAWDFY